MRDSFLASAVHHCCGIERGQLASPRRPDRHKCGRVRRVLFLTANRWVRVRDIRRVRLLVSAACRLCRIASCRFCLTAARLDKWSDNFIAESGRINSLMDKSFRCECRGRFSFWQNCNEYFLRHWGPDAAFYFPLLSKPSRSLRQSLCAGSRAKTPPALTSRGLRGSTTLGKRVQRRTNRGSRGYSTATLGTRAAVGETRALHWQIGQAVNPEE